MRILFADSITELNEREKVMRLFVDHLISFKGCEHHEDYEKGEIGLQDFIEM